MFGNDGLHKLEDKSPSEWRGSAIFWERNSDSKQSKINTFTKQNEILREALEFYSDDYQDWHTDRGEVARQALKEVSEM